MRARVNKAWRWKSILALGGCEFVKGEYRPVPGDQEDEARKHPYLEIEPEAEKPEPEPEKPKAAAKPRVTKGRSK